MTSVDRLGFHLRLKSGDRIHGQRVAFLRAVKDSADTRAVFIEMVRQARLAEEEGFVRPQPADST